MQVAIDEGRRDEPPFRVEFRSSVGGDRFTDARPAPLLGKEVDEPPVEEAGVAHDQVTARVYGPRNVSTSVP